MPLAARPSLNSSAKMQTKMSAWTPLNHQLSNNNVFVERRSLLGKWFDKWSDSQRKTVLQDFLSRCSVGQLRFMSRSLNSQLPLEAADFTCILPRVLSLYLFSFLDPRSLCRCAQVSWHWKSIVELDQLWMPKCMKLGRCISFSLMPFEQGVWKRHYMETVQEPRAGKPQTPASQYRFVVPEVSVGSFGSPEPPEPAPLTEVHSTPAAQLAASLSRRSLGTRTEKQPTGLPPWRDADRHPKDTLRFNYLANLDPAEQAQQVRARSRASVAGGTKAKPEAAGRKMLSETNYKLRKAKSLMFLSCDFSSNGRAHHPPPPPPPPPPPVPPSPPPVPPYPHPHWNQRRPDWAAHSPDNPVTEQMVRSQLQLAWWNAEIRPGPTRSAVPRLSAEGLRAALRSHRSTPSTALFEVLPVAISN